MHNEFMGRRLIWNTQTHIHTHTDRVNTIYPSAILWGHKKGKTNMQISVACQAFHLVILLHDIIVLWRKIYHAEFQTGSVNDAKSVGI